MEPREDVERQRGVRDRRRRGGRVPGLVVPAGASRLRPRWPSRLPRRSSRRIAAALVETIPVRLDDNLSVSATAGGVMWLVSLASLAHLPAGMALPPERLPAALALNALVAWAGHRAQTVSWAGAVTGALVGITVFAGLGWQGWMLLLVTFIAASVASRMGLERKLVLGIAEERGGRRGPGNAIANTGVAAIAAAVALVGARRTMWRVSRFVAALVAGGSDTIASEIGKAWGRRTWSITSLTHVPPGTSGAMSVEGTAAGVAGALGLGDGGRRARPGPARLAPRHRDRRDGRIAARELARRDPRGAGDSQQRHAELHQHRGAPAVVAIAVVAHGRR